VPSKPDIPSLTGLRGVAALLVVTHHYFVWCAPYSLDHAPWWLSAPFNFPDAGMRLFFMLSGFVIYYNYAHLDWLKSPIQVAGTFLWARFARLYPAYILFIVAVLASRGRTDLGWTVLHALSLQSWLPAQLDGNLAVNSTFHVSWSLSTEWGLYVAFTLAMISWSRAPLISAGIASAILAVLLTLRFSSHLFAAFAVYVPQPFEPVTDNMYRWFFYESPYWRILDFGFGAACAIIAERWSHLKLWQPVAPVWRWLSCRPLLLVGEISYSLYLFHFLAPRFGGAANPGQFSVARVPIHMAGMLLTLGFAIALAYGLFHLVENPSRRYLRALTRQHKVSSRQAAPIESITIGQEISHPPRPVPKRGI